MKSEYTSIQEKINELESLQAAREEEIVRLRRQKAVLEARRRELFDKISINSSDFEIRRKLEETEKQAEENHEQLTRVEAELRAVVQERRQEILDRRNEELTRLEQESKALRVRKNEIRNDILPELLARVATLREEEERLNQRGEEIARRIRELNQLDLPNSQVA